MHNLPSMKDGHWMEWRFRKKNDYDAGSYARRRGYRDGRSGALANGLFKWLYWYEAGYGAAFRNKLLEARIAPRRELFTGKCWSLAYDGGGGKAEGWIEYGKSELIFP
jgi:hypothetical protein